MSMSSTSKRYSCWKDYFIKSNTLSYSNLVLNKIRKAVDPSRSFISAVNEIANNPGIAFISLDASGEKLQLFHHVSLIGNSWTSDSEKLVGVLGSSSETLFQFRSFNPPSKKPKEKVMHLTNLQLDSN